VGSVPLVATVMFRLRTYAPGDFESLYEIDQLCYEPEIAYSRRELRNYMRLPGGTCVVAEADGEVAGFCLATHEKGVGYIITMDVLRNYRRHGMGTALLEDIERKLLDVGTRAIWLETATDNEAAIAFWQKHGFSKMRIRRGYYPNGRDAYTMTKTIAPQVETCL
jgi:ribosomal-protein-alanine N-acetyltransferase